MEKKRDDTETPRGLIENMIGHNIPEDTVVAPKKRKFFRTPKEKRLITSVTLQPNEKPGKRRHASLSETLRTAKKQKMEELSESMFTPRTLIEHMTEDGHTAEESVRVDTRVTRAKTAVSESSPANSSRSRASRSSLRKKVAIKQVIRNNSDETTPRGLIEGLIAEGDESVTLRIDTEDPLNKTALADVDIHRRRRLSSLGESFFVSSSAPEPRHLQGRKSSRRAPDPREFAEKVDDQVEQLREHEALGEISATTNPQFDIPGESTQFDKTGDLKRKSSSRKVSAVTPGAVPEISSFHLNDTVQQSEISLERTVDYTTRNRHSVSWPAEQSPQIQTTQQRRSSPRKRTSDASSQEDTEAEKSIAERLSRKRSRENVVAVEETRRSLPPNDVVDDGTYTKNDDAESHEEDEGSSVNEESEKEEDTDDADDERESTELEKQTRPESVNTAEETANVETVPEDMGLDHVAVEDADKEMADEDVEERDVEASRGEGHAIVSDVSARDRMGRRSSTVHSTTRHEEVSEVADGPSSNTTRFEGYDVMQTPQVVTPAQRKEPSPPVRRASQQSDPVAADKPRTKRTTKKGVKSELAARRIPRSITKSIFAHFTTLGFTKDTLDAVEKVSDKFWASMVGDVSAYASHAGRVTVEESDMELLMKRQGFVTDKKSLNTLIEEYLPLEYRQELIPIARAGNTVVPKTKK